LDFFTTLRILLSRWYVVLPALLFTLASAVAASAAVAPSWKANGTLVLLGPATARLDPQSNAKRVETNAYLDFGGTLEITAEILSKIMMSPATAEQLQARGLTAEYEVGTGSDGGSPIINIIATGPDPEIAKATVQGIAGQIRNELQRRQSAAGAPKEDFIRVDQVTTPTSAERQLGSKLRAAAAAGALGLALTFGLAFLAESVAERRAAKERQLAAAGGGPGVGGPAERGVRQAARPGDAHRPAARAAPPRAAPAATGRPSGPIQRPAPTPAPTPARAAADGAQPPRAQRKLDVFATAERQRRLGANDAKSPAMPPATATEKADGAAPGGEVRRLLKSGDRTEPLPALPADELKGLLGTMANSGKLPADPGRPSGTDKGDVWAAPGADPAAKRSEGGDAGTRTSAPGRR